MRLSQYKNSHRSYLRMCARWNFSYFEEGSISFGTVNRRLRLLDYDKKDFVQAMHLLKSYLEPEFYQGPPLGHLGICYHLSTDLTSEKIAIDIVSVLSLNWKHHSGELFYPVLGKTTYDTNFDRWSGQQLKLRLDLIRHLINEIEILLSYFKEEDRK